MFNPTGFESITGGGAFTPSTSTSSGVQGSTNQRFDLGSIGFGDINNGFTTTQIALISVAAVGIAYLMSK
jgi:hypothetical protein